MFGRLTRLWRNLVHRDRVERELDDEMRAIEALLVDEHRQAGVPPDEAVGLRGLRSPASSRSRNGSATSGPALSSKRS